jgi:hypothetical protein
MIKSFKSLLKTKIDARTDDNVLFLVLKNAQISTYIVPIFGNVNSFFSQFGFNL